MKKPFQVYLEGSSDGTNWLHLAKIAEIDYKCEHEWVSRPIPMMDFRLYRFLRIVFVPVARPLTRREIVSIVRRARMSVDGVVESIKMFESVAKITAAARLPDSLIVEEGELVRISFRR